jgi:hypothetical protein
MKIKLALIALLAFTIPGISANSASADGLSVLGGTVSWPDTMYVATGCSKYEIQYANGTGVELLSLGFDLTDPYGASVAWDSQIGIKAGISGSWDIQICSWKFTNGNGPYTMKVTVKDYAGTARSATKQIMFLTAPGAAKPSASNALPTPAPTVTVTARPEPAPTVTVTARPEPAPTVYATNPADENLKALVASLQSQISLLNSKLKKICASKPKPKGC